MLLHYLHFHLPCWSHILIHQTAPWMEPVERRRKPKPSYGYGCGCEHVQNASALRDFVHGCTYALKTRLHRKQEVERLRRQSRGVERGHFTKATAGKYVPYIFNHLYPYKCPAHAPRQLFPTLFYLPHPCGRYLRPVGNSCNMWASHPSGA